MSNFSSFCSQFQHALNSLERYYGTTHHGSLARSTKQGHLVENTLHSHSHKPHKGHHSHFSYNSLVATEKQNKQTRTEAMAWKNPQFWQCSYRSTLVQHIHTMSHFLTSPAYIFIYLVAQVNGLSVQNRMANSRRWGLKILLAAGAYSFLGMELAIPS